MRNCCFAVAAAPPAEWKPRRLLCDSPKHCEFCWTLLPPFTTQGNTKFQLEVRKKLRYILCFSSQLLDLPNPGSLGHRLGSPVRKDGRSSHLQRLSQKISRRQCGLRAGLESQLKGIFTLWEARNTKEAGPQPGGERKQDFLRPSGSTLPPGGRGGQCHCPQQRR